MSTSVMRLFAAVRLVTDVEIVDTADANRFSSAPMFDRADEMLAICASIALIDACALAEESNAILPAVLAGDPTALVPSEAVTVLPSFAVTCTELVAPETTF